MNMNMNGKKMLNIFAILGTLSLILGNIALPSYAFLKQTSQSQVYTDPGIDKQVLKGVALILKGVNTILMGYALKKVVRLAAVVVGLFFAGIVYLQYQ